ncbi:MAG TPA: DUF192 domain-containing protein [Firmicutes bacterium]|nr:DUF192 domain-containing protein [Bacillota bacterium]
MARLLTVINETRGVVLGRQIEVAATFWARAKGLLGRRGLEEGGGLLLYPCSAIHSFGMRFEFDALYLDRHYRVVHVVDRMPPNRLGRSVWRVFAVLELPAGTAAATGTAVGDQLAVRWGTNPTAFE